MSVRDRQGWIAPSADLSQKRQCKLAGVARATIYRRRIKNESESAPGQASAVDPHQAHDLMLCALIDGEYTAHPFYGSRRMVVHLSKCGHSVNRKRVQRLMRAMGLAGMAPGPNTSGAHPQHKVYPYLLRGLPIVRTNQVWSSDITYIRVRGGFAYLVAVIDWYSRAVLSWRISNTMDASLCVGCLEEAIRLHGKPEIFNSDQGSQFTSEAFTGVLKAQRIAISMDGRGRALDNIFVERLWRSVKYEDIYLKGYDTLGELFVGLSQYFTFYNNERPHQGLNNLTPSAVYASGQGGGAMIVDRYGVTETAVTQNAKTEVSKDASGGPAGGQELKTLLEKQASAVQLREESSIT